MPEGSIAEGYVALECLTFCSRYLRDVETKFTRQRAEVEHTTQGVTSDCSSIFTPTGQPIGASILRDLTTKEWKQRHLYVLNQCEEVGPYIE
jgi:hypothetical protein